MSVKRFTCDCDIGSVLIGNADWTFAVPNIGGDGTTAVRIYDSNAEFSKDHWTTGMKFISSVQGEFNLFEYDCAFEDLRRGKPENATILATLNGRYGVYHGNWKVAFVQWEDWSANQ